MSKQAAEYVHPDSLVPWEKNPRRNEHVVEKIAASIKEFGFASPIVARISDRRIIAGHTRWKAAKSIGMTEVPVRFMELTDEQATALTIADNRLGDLAIWDENKLGDLLSELRDVDVGSLDVLGFQQEELDALFGEWEDPFLEDDFDDDDEPQIVDDGKSKIVVTVPVTKGSDVSRVIHDALLAHGLSDDDYHLRVV